MIAEGYRNLSMRKIAAEAGITATSIYLHFKNKDHLLHTLMDESIQELNERLESVASAVDDPVNRLEKMAGEYIRFAYQNPQKYQIIYWVRGEEMKRYPREKFRAARRGYHILEDAIREANDKGIIEEVSPHIAAYVIWAELHGVMSVVLSKRLDVRIDTQAFLDEALEHVINGFKVKYTISDKSGKSSL